MYDDILLVPLDMFYTLQRGSRKRKKAYAHHCALLVLHVYKYFCCAPKAIERHMVTPYVVFN